MVLAKIFREEARAEGIKIGRAKARAESQAKIAELEEQVKRLEAAKGKPKE